MEHKLLAFTNRCELHVLFRSENAQKLLTKLHSKFIEMDVLNYKIYCDNGKSYMRREGEGSEETFTLEVLPVLDTDIKAGFITTLCDIIECLTHYNLTDEQVSEIINSEEIAGDINQVLDHIRLDKSEEDLRYKMNTSLYRVMESYLFEIKDEIKTLFGLDILNGPGEKLNNVLILNLITDIQYEIQDSYNNEYLEVFISWEFIKKSNFDLDLIREIIKKAVLQIVVINLLSDLDINEDRELLSEIEIYLSNLDKSSRYLL